MLPMTPGPTTTIFIGRVDVARDLREWECSAGASALGEGSPTGRLWSKPRQCTSRQRRRARHGWSRYLQKLLHVQPGSPPTRQSSRSSTSSSSGTSSLLAPYPACGAGRLRRVDPERSLPDAKEELFFGDGTH